MRDEANCIYYDEDWIGMNGWDRTFHLDCITVNRERITWID